MFQAYEGLWDDVTKQFLKHTDVRVIDQAVKTIRFFLASSTLGNTNSVKIAELEDRLVTSMRKAVDGKDVESSAFEEDELLALRGWVARIEKLYGVKDISTSLDDTDDGKHSSAWEIVDSLVERGRLGYKDEMAVSSDAACLVSAADPDLYTARGPRHRGARRPSRLEHHQDRPAF